jgi:hypothetical protein
VEAKEIERLGRDKNFVDGINIRVFNLLRKYYGNEKTVSIFIKNEPPSMGTSKGYLSLSYLSTESSTALWNINKPSPPWKLMFSIHFLLFSFSTIAWFNVLVHCNVLIL